MKDVKKLQDDVNTKEDKCYCHYRSEDYKAKILDSHTIHKKLEEIRTLQNQMKEEISDSDKTVQSIEIKMLKFTKYFDDIINSTIPITLTANKQIKTEENNCPSFGKSLVKLHINLK